MNPELTALKEAMDGLDFVTARELATAYVAAHPDEFAEYSAMAESAETEQAAIQSVVHAVEVFRAAGLLESQYRAEAWHLHTWDPQDIGGAVRPRRRNN